MNKAESDEFLDAVEGEESEDGEREATFEVTKEELSIIRAELASEFPEEYQSLSDDYVLSVASKPYSKDPTVRRPLDYSMDKLKGVMKWRTDKAIGLTDMLTLAEGPSTATEAVEDPDRYTKAKALATSMNYASMYWHGLDKKGRPILWIRTDRMPWYPDVEAQVNVLIILAEEGIKVMPEGITDFVVLSDSNSPPPPNPQFMMNLLDALVKGYPDRLKLLISCPVGSIIQFVMNLLIPLMPGRLASKIVLVSQDDSKGKLGEILLNGEEDIPTFLGGTKDHEQMYPKSGKFSDRTLTFDFEGMKERLAKSVEEFKSKQ